MPGQRAVHLPLVVLQHPGGQFERPVCPHWRVHRNDGGGGHAGRSGPHLPPAGPDSLSLWDAARLFPSPAAGAASAASCTTRGVRFHVSQVWCEFNELVWVAHWYDASGSSVKSEL